MRPKKPQPLSINHVLSVLYHNIKTSQKYSMIGNGYYWHDLTYFPEDFIVVHKGITYEIENPISKVFFEALQSKGMQAKNYLYS